MDANFATTSMYSLMDFYEQQQSWVTSQLLQPSSDAAGPSSCSYDQSPSPAPSASSTLSVSSCFTHSSSSTERSKNKRHSQRPSQRRRGPVRNMRPAPKWARRHLPSLHRIANNSSRTHKLRPVARIALRMRTVTLRKSQPTQMMMLTATTTPPLEEQPTISVPLSSPRAPSPDTMDLLVRYQLMIGDRMESCMRLQSMINEAYGGPQRV
ncbi:hypothetical protein FRB93_012372 [Tulasnella sp. JGI-2019a]|nr:hypothetical protein FRB93_012372 [Tulasnella sp. JGI-2019a]